MTLRLYLKSLFVMVVLLSVNFEVLWAKSLNIGDTKKIERAALLAFYHSTKGDNWVRQDDWGLEKIPHCQWFGVKCTDKGYVQELQLYDNNLDGPLPTSFCDLKYLETIYFSFNHISGHLPATLKL